MKVNNCALLLLVALFCRCGVASCVASCSIAQVQTLTAEAKLDSSEDWDWEMLLIQQESSSGAATAVRPNNNTKNKTCSETIVEPHDVEERPPLNQKQSFLRTLLDLFTPFAVQVGLTCLVAQLFLRALFATECFGKGPWSAMPAFTAHQAVTFPVVVYMSVQGLRQLMVWQEETTAVDRLTGPTQHLHMMEFVLGVLFFWDIPTYLLTPALRDLPMIMHHVGMFVTAAIAMGALSNGTPVVAYYAPFFFGVIELSSLPLIVADFCHPKHKAWHAYLTSEERPPWLARVNEVSRFVFMASFFVISNCCFLYVTFFGVVADVRQVASLPLDERNGVPILPLVIMAALNVTFSCLELYWGSLLLRQNVKRLLRGPSSKSNESLIASSSLLS